MLTSADGLRYEITGHANGALKSTQRSTKVYTAPTSRAGGRRIPVLNPSTVMRSVTVATNTLVATQPSTINGKLTRKDKMSSTSSSSQATPIRRKIGLWKPSIGLRSLKNSATKPAFSFVHLVLLFTLVRVAYWVAGHLVLHNPFGWN